jgi:hypothetical protein
MGLTFLHETNDGPTFRAHIIRKILENDTETIKRSSLVEENLTKLSLATNFVILLKNSMRERSIILVQCGHYRQSRIIKDHSTVNTLIITRGPFTMS